MEILAHTNDSKRLSLLSTSAVALITFLLLMAHQFIVGHQQLKSALETEAAIIGANSSAALIFNDHAAAYETLGAARLNPRITGAALYRSNGELFILIDDPNAFFPDTINPQEQDAPIIGHGKTGFLDGFLHQKISQHGAWVGTVVLHFTYLSLLWNLLEYAAGLFLIGGLALYLARRFTARLRRKMALTKEQLEQMALYDRITGLPNRRYFEHSLKKAISRIKRERENAALLLIDVDDFKKVNDQCGHHAGDEVLRMIAERLRQSVRDDDLIARIGGDEFAAILFKVGDPENVSRIAHKMITAISKPFPTQPTPSHVGLSIGITLMPNDSDDPATLQRWADMAMYEAKRQGKNRAQFFSEEINNKVSADLEIEALLRKTLHAPQNGLFIAYQPQISAQTRQIVGVEALIRWRLDDGRFIPPGDFIPVAEKSGLIIDIGAWLVPQVCRDLSTLRLAGIELPKVAINVSPREMTRGHSIVENARTAIEAFGEDVGRFQFEITENALMNDSDTEILSAFRQVGFSLAIDDFGTGYSSLGYLKRFQVGTLKIDQSFIQSLPDDSEDAAIVTAVIQMTRALGIDVVAEGVETAAQAEFLTAKGCDILQGYHFSRPLPVPELIAFVKSHPS